MTTDRIDHRTGEVLPGLASASPTIGALAAALVKAQAEMPTAAKDARNPHLNTQYADLASVWIAAKGALTKHGLAVLQRPGLRPRPESGPIVTVETILAHTSGEWVASEVALTPAPDKAGNWTPQIIGSAITYGRRYGLAAMVGVVADDDDGHAASQPTRPAAAPRSQERRLAAPPAPATEPPPPDDGDAHLDEYEATRSATPAEPPAAPAPKAPAPAPAKAGPTGQRGIAITDEQGRAIKAIARSKGMSPEAADEFARRHFQVPVAELNIDEASYVIKELQRV